MTILNLLLAAERAMPLTLFALYMVTSFQICRYASWRQAGAPNPFLPRRLKVVVAPYEKRLRVIG